MLASNDSRRPRPEPNLIYHVRDKQSPVAPLAEMVPVQLASTGAPAAKDVKPVRAASATLKWSSPIREKASPVDRIAATDLRRGLSSPNGAAAGANLPHPVMEDESTTRTAAVGWHLQQDASSVQVAHPQPLEVPRQTILR